MPEFDRRINVPQFSFSLRLLILLLILAGSLAAYFIVIFGEEQQDPSTADSIYSRRQEWHAVDGTHPNVSHFIYHDTNRNGIYDVGDRPMVRIAVRMFRPDGSSVIRYSNLRGFVNFTNSLTASPVDVDEPGEYMFEVIVPNGWVLTSDNTVQIANYREDPTTRPGIIADRVPEPAGLAQALTIGGRVARRTGSGAFVPPEANEISLSAISPSGTSVDIPVDGEGGFSFPAKKGLWTIQVNSADKGLVAERTTFVENVPVQLSTIFLNEAYIGEPAQKLLVVDFEDVTLSVITKIPNGYAGLDWNNLIVTDNELYGGEGYVNNTISGEYVAYNTSGYPVTISHVEGFDFYGGYFGVAWYSAEGETLEVRAWRNEELLAEEEYQLSALGPFHFDAAYHNITRLELSTCHYWQFVADDLSFGLYD